MTGQEVLFSSVSPHWLTPQHIVALVLAHFGRIELDPCPGVSGNIPAARGYTEAEDGLSRPWKAETVYLNPPYGRAISKWTTKLLAERPRYREAIALLPARTDTAWWHDLMDADPIVCEVKGRLKFRLPHPGPKPERPEGMDDETWEKLALDYAKALKAHHDPDAAPFPSAVVYIGPRAHAFADIFAEIGRNQRAY